MDLVENDKFLSKLVVFWCRWRGSPVCGRSGGAEKQSTGLFFNLCLLRCPKQPSGLRLSSAAFDRCHSLRSLHLPPAALPSLPLRPPYSQIRKTKRTPFGVPLLCLWATKKILSAVLRMNSNSCKNEILADARMKSAMQMKSADADEIKSTHRRSDFIRPKGGFHHRR